MGFLDFLSPVLGAVTGISSLIQSGHAQNKADQLSNEQSQQIQQQIDLINQIRPQYMNLLNQVSGSSGQYTMDPRLATINPYSQANQTAALQTTREGSTADAKRAIDAYRLSQSARGVAPGGTGDALFSAITNRGALQDVAGARRDLSLQSDQFAANRDMQLDQINYSRNQDAENNRFIRLSQLLSPVTQGQGQVVSEIGGQQAVAQQQANQYAGGIGSIFNALGQAGVLNGKAGTARGSNTAGTNQSGLNPMMPQTTFGSSVQGAPTGSAFQPSSLLASYY